MSPRKPAQSIHQSPTPRPVGKGPRIDHNADGTSKQPSTRTVANRRSITLLDTLDDYTVHRGTIQGSYTLTAHGQPRELSRTEVPAYIIGAFDMHRILRTRMLDLFSAAIDDWASKNPARAELMDAHGLVPAITAHLSTNDLAQTLLEAAACHLPEERLITPKTAKP